MAENALIRAVRSLELQADDYQKGREVEANAQHYRDLSKELRSLHETWLSLQRVYRLAEVITVPAPEGRGELECELQDLLCEDFRAFERRYLSRGGVSVVRTIRTTLIRQMEQMRSQLQRGFQTAEQQIVGRIEDLLTRARIRKQCGLSSDEEAAVALQRKFSQLFAALRTCALSVDGIKDRWQELRSQLDLLDKQHPLAGITGLSAPTVDFLQRLMGEDKGRRPTLADLQPTIYSELQQFPTLLSKVVLMRKGDDR